MAASLSGFVLLPNPNASFYGAWADATSLSSTAAAHRGLDPARSPLTKTCLGARLVLADRKPSKFIVLAASHEESKHLDIEAEKDNDSVNKNAGSTQQVWKEALDRFKIEGLKVKAVSGKAYAVYSKKTREMLMDKLSS